MTFLHLILFLFSNCSSHYWPWHTLCLTRTSLSLFSLNMLSCNFLSLDLCICFHFLVGTHNPPPTLHVEAIADQPCWMRSLCPWTHKAVYALFYRHFHTSLIPFTLNSLVLCSHNPLCSVVCLFYCRELLIYLIWLLLLVMPLYARNGGIGMWW